MNKILGNTAVFVILYIVLMIPTYLLPYLGSNSSVINTTGLAAGAGMNPAFWFHIAALLVLVVLAWFRGSNVGKAWLVVFPVMALVFDLIPVLSSIPMVPTIMHLLAIILGVVGASKAAVTTDASASSS